jgi:TolB protein
MFSGGSPKITLDGNLGEPVTITTEKQVYRNVTLPHVVQVNRHHLNGQRIHIQSEDQQYPDVVLRKSINPLTFLNIFNYLVGWPVDLATNCVSKPAQSRYYVQGKEYKVYAITAGGENLSALTKITDDDNRCTMPSGGDNGKNLFYLKRSHDGANVYSNIFKKDNPLATASSEKTSGKNRHAHPSYCEAIDKIVFRFSTEGNSSSDIYMMSASQGKALTQVTDSRGDWEDNPTFSHNGTYIAYDKSPSGVNMRDTEVWLKNRETGENTLLGKGAQPSFSPDGKKIAYIKYTGTDANIYIMGIDGENQVQITDSKKGYAQDPKWSPDGNYLIFSASKDGKNPDIYVIRTDGEMLTQLTTNESTDAQPYWSKDGFIYFTSDRGGKEGNFQIWRFKY